MNIKKDIRFRVYLSFTAITVFAAAILVKAAMIQVNEGPELRSLAQKLNIKGDTLEADRGNIISEDGVLLCSTIPQFNLHVDFTVINADTFKTYVDTLAKSLATVLKNKNAEQWKSTLIGAYNDSDRYFSLAKKIKYYDYQAIRSFPIFNKGQRRGGIITDVDQKRVNPYGKLAYRTIGLWRPGIWIDKKLVKNVVGVEASYDSILSGTNGYCVRQRISGNRWAIVDGSVIEPVEGKDVVTTIDMSIQDVAEHSLQAVLEKYQCQYGTVIVMEVATGKIRAMANLGRQKDGSYWEDYNYALLPTEPGSTFKLATLTALLQDGLINVEDKVNCSGGVRQFGNRLMKDSHYGLGVMPIRNAFAQSSNVGMAALVYDHYFKNPAAFSERLNKLGLNIKTGIDIPGERTPRVMHPNDKDWSATTLPWMAIGYGVLVSPLHTCMLYNAVANNGKIMKPYLVSAIKEYGNTVETFAPTQVGSLGNEDVVRQLKSCVEEVAITGTGKHIKSPFYNIAGKTGTAQVADKGIRYSDGVYQGSFVGYFPAENPKYTMAVVLRTKPRSGAYYGGTIAAPIFRMIADKIFAMSSGSWEGPIDSISKVAEKKLHAKPAIAGNYSTVFGMLGTSSKIPLDNAARIARLQQDSSGKAKLKITELADNVIPDVSGMGLKDAIYLLEKLGLNTTVIGKGTVIQQSIPAGSKAVKGQTISLQLG